MNILTEYTASIKLAASNIKKISLTILFDILFFSVVFVLSNYLNTAFPKDAESIRSMFGSSIVILVAIIVYYLLFFFIYTIFKFFVLDILASLSSPSNERLKFNLKNVWKFFSMNVIVFVILVLVAGIISYVLRAVEPGFTKYYTLVLIIPFLILSYVFVNFCHSVFFNGKSLSSTKNNENTRKAIRIIAESLRITFSKQWASLFLFNIAALIVCLAIFAGLGFILNKIAGNSVGLAQNYQTISNILLFVIFYILFVVNRIFFFSKAKSLNKTAKTNKL